jgi:hypothetical protein
VLPLGRRLTAIVVGAMLAAIAGGEAAAAAAAPGKVRPCKLLKQPEITTAFGMETSRGSAKSATKRV